MTKKQFDDGIGLLFGRDATKKIFAVVGPDDSDHYVIMNDQGADYLEAEEGILIRHGRTFHYLPYDTIIALTGER